MKNFIIVLVSLLYITTSFAQDDIYSKLENQNQKDIIFNQSITRDDLNDKDKVILDKISNKLSNIYGLTENSANYKYNVAVIIKKINTFLKTKLIDKGRTYDNISTTSKQAVLILNVYMQGLMKSITGNITTQTNIINTSTGVTNATYKGIPYNKDGTITISKDLVIKQFDGKANYSKNLFNSLNLGSKMIYSQNLGNKDVGIDMENVSYHRFYASDGGKAQLVKLLYDMSLNGLIISITEIYSNGNKITFTSTIYANKPYTSYEGTIGGSSFGFTTIMGYQNAGMAGMHGKYDGRTSTMYVPSEYEKADTSY